MAHNDVPDYQLVMCHTSW